MIFRGGVQRRLAVEMTRLVHGDEEAARVERAAEVLFQGGDLREVPAEYLADAFDGAPVADVPRERLRGDGVALVDLVADVVFGGGQVRGKSRRAIAVDQSISVNGDRWIDPDAKVTGEHLLHGRYLVLKKGKRNHYLVRAEG